MNLDKVGNGIAGFVTAIIGVAIVAVILSQGANTVNVLGTFFSGFSQLLQVVISPVTGGANFASGTSGQTGTYAGQITLGGLYGGTTGSSGLALNGIGSLNLSNSAINSLLNYAGSGSSADSGALIGGSFG